MRFKTIPVKCIYCEKIIDVVQVSENAKFNVIWDICWECKNKKK